MNTIEWRTIKGFEDYQVNNIGDVRRIVAKIGTRKKVPYLLKKRVNSDGYIQYVLANYNNGITKNIGAHRLVALAFIENDNPLRNQVNHINGNKQDNRVENLEWVTQAENRQHFHKYLEWNWKNNPLKSKPVLQYDLQGNFVREFPSQTEVERQLGFNQSCVSRVCRGERKYYNGYIWKFKSTESQEAIENISTEKNG